MQLLKLAAVVLGTVVASKIKSKVVLEIGALCKNGTFSGSSGSGTCSHNGGVNIKF